MITDSLEIRAARLLKFMKHQDPKLISPHQAERLQPTHSM